VIGVEGDQVKPRPNSKSNDIITIPKGHCWVEGDNWVQSRDSNTFGPVFNILPFNNNNKISFFEKKTKLSDGSCVDSWKSEKSNMASKSLANGTD